MSTSTADKLLRVTMVWAGTTSTGPLRLAAEWARTLDCESSPPVACIWSPSPMPAGLNSRDSSPVQFCWHELRLPERIDRHCVAAHPRSPWSPWGSKSGPNFQFFQVLEAFAEAHPHQWILAAEPDTYPIGRDPSGVVRDLLARNPNAWMIGGFPHPSLLDKLDPRIHHHLNGAAVYAVGDPTFREFLSNTWIPSLLWKIRELPEYAYDCLTDPAENSALPDFLAKSWDSSQHKFISTAGIVNLSNRKISVSVAQRLCTEDSLLHQCTEERTTPWMLHAKGSLDGTWRLETESRT